MKSGTRRMWSRRVLRAGWLIAPVLQYPAKAWGFFFGEKDRAFWTISMTLVAAGITSCVKHDIHMDAVSTPAEIESALKGNHCMIDLVPRRQKIDLKGGPIKNRDLYLAERDCKNFWEAKGQVAAQQEVLKRMAK